MNLGRAISRRRRGIRRCVSRGSPPEPPRADRRDDSPPAGGRPSRRSHRPRRAPARGVRRRWRRVSRAAAVGYGKRGIERRRARGAQRPRGRDGSPTRVFRSKGGVSMPRSGSSARRPRGAALLAVGAVALVAALAAPTFGAAGQQAAKGTRRCPTGTRALPVATRVADLLARMTLDEKIGQMTQAERVERRRRPARSPPTARQHPVRRRLGAATEHAGRLGRHGRRLPARRARHAGSHIPMIYGVDAVHGDNNVYGATIFPHNIGLGATRDPALVATVEHVAAEETGHRAALDVRAVPLRRPRRPLGPHLRVLRREPRARRTRWDRDRRASRAAPGQRRPRPRPGDREALRRRRRHHLRHRTGRQHPIDQGVDQVAGPLRPARAAPYIPAVGRTGSAR